MTALHAMLRQLCPRCRTGRIFRPVTKGRWISVNESCPVCNLRLDRGEPGYFIGAMYVSYAISIPPVLAIVFAFWRMAHWSLGTAVLAAFVAYLPVVPLIVRISRVIWIYMDRAFDPS
ncbi:MAG TPA: DUF983 domain-containing protein [Bryobacteraceae bacterium]|nr:DUF983 domain-containing protein [Bryobacteraceae bacterium]